MRLALAIIALASCSAPAQVTHRVAQIDINGFGHTFDTFSAVSHFELGGPAGCQQIVPEFLDVIDAGAGINYSVIEGPFVPSDNDTLEFAISAPPGAYIRLNRDCILDFNIQTTIDTCCFASPFPVRAYVLRDGLLVQDPIDTSIAPGAFLAGDVFVSGIALKPATFNEIVFRLEDILAPGLPANASTPPEFPFGGSFRADGDFANATCDERPATTAQIVFPTTGEPGVVRVTEIEIAGFTHLLDQFTASSAFESNPLPGECLEQPNFLLIGDEPSGICYGVRDGSFDIGQGDAIELAIVAPAGQAIRLQRECMLNVQFETALDACCVNSPHNVTAFIKRDGLNVIEPIDTGVSASQTFTGFEQFQLPLPACTFDEIVFRISDLQEIPVPIHALPPLGPAIGGEFAAFGDFSGGDCTNPGAAFTAVIVGNATGSPIGDADANADGITDIIDLLLFLSLWFGAQ